MIGGVVMVVALTLVQGSERLEVDPVTCWWRTSTTAVRVGEPFTVILTCSLLATEAARVVADESRLDPAVVQLQPFEVIGGARADDVTTEGRRFVQYEYRLRAVAENVFATEAALPPLEITYRVQSRIAAGNTLAGRDLTYAMPPLTMRVLSLVPDTAQDIREAPIATFADVERLRSRGAMLRAAALAAIAAGVVLFVLAAAGSLHRRRAARAPAHRTVPAGTVLAAVRRDLTAVRDQARAAGWNDDLVARALAAARVVAAYGTGRPVTQRQVPKNPAASVPGEVVVERGSAAVAVSSPITSTPDEELQAAIAQFTDARYGRGGTSDRLDEAVDATIERADRVASTRHFREGLWARWRR